MESEKTFKVIFNNAADGILVADAESKKFYMGNAVICQELGYSTDELKNLGVADIHPEQDLPYVIEQFEKQARREITLAKDIPVKKKDGSIFYADVNSLPITLSGKKCLMGVFRDVTERKKSEEALRESEARYRTLVEQLPAITYIAALDEASTTVYISPQVEDFIGFNSEEYKADPDIWRKQLHPDDRDHVLKKVIQSHAKKEPFLEEYRMIAKDGSIIWFRDEAIIVKDEKSQPLFLQGVMYNITEHKEAENALQQSEIKHRTLLENLPQRIFLKDGNSVYVSCNEHFASDLNIKPDEIVGKTDYDFFPKELAEKYRADDKRIIESGQTKDIEEKAILQGREMIVHTVKTPVKDEQGNIIGVLGIFWDITKRKKMEEELDRYREQMARAEQLASLGTLSATVAHELTQPLTVISLLINNALDELKTTSSPQSVIKKLKESLNQVSDLTSIVERFRSFTRKSSGKTEEEVDLKAVTERIVNLLNESARRAKIRLRLKDMDTLPPLYADEKDLEQVFFALIDNAIQAADGQKARSLIISGFVKDEHVELRFSDDCGGIAQENIDKIFEPFFTTKPPGQGTGLGLCIVQDIVFRFGGKVRVESKFGKGTTFFVTLPINEGMTS